MRFPFQIKSSSGYTLLESLIVFVIILVLSGLFLGFDRASDRQVSLISEQAKAVAVFERAKSMTLQKYREGDVSVIGFMVKIYTDSHNSNPNEMHIIQLIEGGVEDVVVERVDFDPRISLTWEGGGSEASVKFFSPYLRTEGSGTLILSIKGGRNPVSIEVGSGGAITPNN